MKRMTAAIGLFLVLAAVALAGPNPVCTPGVGLYQDYEYAQYDVDVQYLVIAEVEQWIVDKQIEISNEMATHGCSDPQQCATLAQLLNDLYNLQTGRDIAYEALDEYLNNRDAAIDSYKEHCAFTCIHGCSW